MRFNFLIETQYHRFWIKLHPLHAVQCILKLISVVRLLFSMKGI